MAPENRTPRGFFCGCLFRSHRADRQLPLSNRYRGVVRAGYATEACARRLRSTPRTPIVQDESRSDNVSRVIDLSNIQVVLQILFRPPHVSHDLTVECGTV